MWIESALVLTTSCTVLQKGSSVFASQPFRTHVAADFFLKAVLTYVGTCGCMATSLSQARGVVRVLQLNHVQSPKVPFIISHFDRSHKRLQYVVFRLQYCCNNSHVVLPVIRPQLVYIYIYIYLAVFLLRYCYWG